jgi:asparagine synthase (glutamine-hydrolysing)
MCGIAGLWQRRGAAAAAVGPALRAMLEAIRHRGPDGEGHLLEPEAGLGLGHLRLAIQDLSSEGAQPMASASGRFVLVYNGEIYNVGALRSDLAALGWRFRGTSDTEIFLAALEQWGLEHALERAAGMFAMAIWDRERRDLTLVRDRLGKKPLYLAEIGPLLLFGSELKALMRHPALDRRIDPGALASYLRFGYVPEPHAILSGVRKIAPGTIESFGADGSHRVTRFWDLAEVARRGRSEPLPDDPVLLREATLDILDRAVRERLVADVPLGAFLSGGIDSSLVVALMRRHGPSPRTFSIGFEDPRFDEGPFAARIAAHLGTRHTAFTLTAADALGIIPSLPEMFDEPFADSSQIPTHLVARLARSEVTVALTGDGGDEIAGGYRRHVEISRWWPRLAALPPPLRRAAGRVLSGLPAGLVDGVARLASRAPGHAAERVRKAGEILGERDPRAIYALLVTNWRDTRGLCGADPLPSPVDDAAFGTDLGLLGMLRLLDIATYLPGDILAKVDRATMAVALEARSPFLDHRVVEHFWRLPDTALVQGRRGKAILRDLLAEHVPPALFERPKTGFGIPLGDWLRGPLSDWAEGLIADEMRGGQLAMREPAALMRAHQAGRGNHQHRLWTILMLLAWMRHWGARLP